MRAYDLGTFPYLDAWRLQEALASRVRSGGEESVVLVEHPHVFTVGRRGSLDHLTIPARRLAELGARAYRVDRGGDITYHGPGQLVVYPIVDLAARGGDLVAYVRGLEAAFITVAERFGVAARRVPDRTGVWAALSSGQDAKLAAIGVRVSRGVTTHGVALNVRTDLSWFDRMVPCGFAHRATSLTELGVAAGVDEVKPVVLEALADSLGVEIRDGGMPDPARDEEIPADAPVRSAEDLLRDAVGAVAS